MMPPIVATAGGNDPRIAALLQARGINAPALAMQQARQQVMQPQQLTQPVPQSTGADVRAQILIDQARATSPMYHPLEAVGRVVSAYTGAKLAKQAQREEQEKQTATLKAMGMNDQQISAYQAGITDIDSLRAFGLAPPAPADNSKIVKSVTETVPGPDGEPMLVELRMNAAGEVVDRQVLANPKGVTVQTGKSLDDIRGESGARTAGGLEGRRDTIRAEIGPLRNAAIAKMREALSMPPGPEAKAKYEAAFSEYAGYEAQYRNPLEAVTQDSVKLVTDSMPGYIEARAMGVFGSDPLGAALGDQPASKDKPAEQGADDFDRLWNATE